MKTHYCGRSGALSTSTIGAILLRDDWTCAYCGERVPWKKLHLDHVIHRSEGGRHIAGNLVVACRECNLARGNGPIPKHARAEVRRRLRLAIDRIAGRKLGDKLYPWARERRADKKRRKEQAKERANRITKAEGLEGTSFPYGENAA